MYCPQNFTKVTLGEFHIQRENELEKLHDITETIYANKLVKIYKDLKLEEALQCLRVAKSSYREGQPLPITDNQGPIVADESDHDYDKQKALIKRYQAHIKESFLLIRAPVRNDNTGMSREEEEIMRMNQYKYFGEIYPGFCNGHSTRKQEISVDSKEDLMRCVEDFMNNSNSVDSAVLIYNGHGTENGLYVGQGEIVPLDEFTAKVKGLFARETSEFPLKVEIIFAQCWGHKFNEIKYPHFKVTGLTCSGPTSEKTQNVQVSEDPLDRKHLQLQRLAEKRAYEDNASQNIDVHTHGENIRTTVDSIDVEPMDYNCITVVSVNSMTPHHVQYQQLSLKEGSEIVRTEDSENQMDMASSDQPGEFSNSTVETLSESVNPNV